MGKVNGKFAIVTGAAMGNGLGITEILAKEGATVAMFDKSDEVFASAKRLESEGYKVLPIIVDVTDKESVNKGVEKAHKEFGRIDILVCNAGIARIVPFLEMSDEIRDLHWNVNINGIWNCHKAVVPIMIEQGYGRIVNMSSVSGPMVVDTGEGAYAPSKAAAWGFTKAMALELAPHGICVNMVCPGYVDTPMTAGIAKDSNPDNPDSVKQGIAASTPLGRLATIQEIGYAATFLASDEASYITGQQIVIDGGSTLPETAGAVGSD